MGKLKLFLFVLLMVSNASAFSVKVLDRNGIEIKTYLDESDLYNVSVKIEEVSPWLILSTIAAEDKRFYDCA